MSKDKEYYRGHGSETAQQHQRGPTEKDADDDDTANQIDYQLQDLYISLDWAAAKYIKVSVGIP